MSRSRRVTPAILLFVLLLVGCAAPVRELRPTPSPTTGPDEAGTLSLPATSPTPAPLPAESQAAAPAATEAPQAPGAISSASPAPTAGTAPEAQVTEIPLSDPLRQPSAQVSGLAWYGETLILLPQYPDFSVKDGDGAVYAVTEADLVSYLDGFAAGPLAPHPIPFVAPGLAGQIDGFEGYEAIAFLGDRAFLTIEADTARGMRGYLVSGQMAPDLSSLTLDTATLTEISPQSDRANRSDEALLVAGDRLVTIYELNGAAVNPSPVAHLFDLGLAPAGTLPFPQIEYRITDVTELDGEGRFWATNYFFPADMDLRTGIDPLAERYGWGPSHTPEGAVERLVEFQLTHAGIALADRPPIQLELPDDLLGMIGRNWEGLARLDQRGFLLVTDTFPGTLLAFVPAPEGE